ncbi:uncharacterized protein C8R40DRAFT_1126070 [Lentinula edodes]|uniref:uncharacterized protein n=1 Tax=Lentinula edodes TaxID=5353 RepID=UPI001E8D841E|nr:uncharacterized protein C8R40DRAFT_1126070 [Lentinula edodes]KAH7870509.1 hypothetical protein C8R40DRAFT_1126070 [Lentinula edodes]
MPEVHRLAEGFLHFFVCFVSRQNPHSLWLGLHSPRKGFSTHSHREFEFFLYIMDGKLGKA